MAGKSKLVLDLLKFQKQLFTTEFSKILYFIPDKHLLSQQPFLDSLKKACPIIDIRGTQPTFADYRDSSLPKILIFDDFQLSIHAGFFEELFSQDSHHYR
jgi:hypothetical protein